jgi:DNA-directed RNA polymerase specialized sigma24 family protein
LPEVIFLPFSTHGESFPLTRYSVVAAVKSSNEAERRAAIDAIAAAYWRPVYKYIRLRWNVQTEEAQDATQDFFAQLIEKEFLATYDVNKARMRTFLRTCIDRMMMNRSRDAVREKRGGGAAHLSLDFADAEHELAAASVPASMDEFFEREWVRSLFGLAVERMKASCTQAGKQKQFAVFEACDLVDRDEKPSYVELARRFGIAVTDVTNYLSLTRREFRRCVLEQLRAMTGSDDEYRREAQALLGVDPK